MNAFGAHSGSSSTRESKTEADNAKLSPISFSNDDIKASICSKAQSTITNIAGLVKAIIKNSHTNDHLTTILKQFSTSDHQLVSTQDHIDKIEHICQQLLFQSDLLRLDIEELTKINENLRAMELDDH